jgi:LisH domain-containing protein ARMC9
MEINTRRSAQSAMISQELSTWIITLLQDLENVSEATIEAGAALLMNLCLRTNGVKECVRDPTRTLVVISELIEHDNIQVKTYVNGLLYSLFADDAMRQKARMIGMDEQLRQMKSSSDENLRKQIEFVIERLESGSHH